MEVDDIYQRWQVKSRIPAVYVLDPVANECIQHQGFTLGEVVRWGRTSTTH